MPRFTDQVLPFSINMASENLCVIMSLIYILHILYIYSLLCFAAPLYEVDEFVEGEFIVAIYSVVR